MIKLFYFIKRVFSKIHKIFQNYINKKEFKYYGDNIAMKRPVEISGKEYIHIGDNCNIFEGIYLVAVSKWRDSSYTPEIVIGEKTSIGENCHITCANKLTIGKNSSIMCGAVITDIEHEHVPGKSLRETGLIVGSVEIGDNVCIGAGACIFGDKNIKIGDNAVIGANAVVKNDVPANTIVAGIPARVIKKI